MKEIIIKTDGINTSVSINGVDMTDLVSYIDFKHAANDIPICNMSLISCVDYVNHKTKRGCLGKEGEKNAGIS